MNQCSTMFPSGHIHFGVTPTLWSNDDFRDIDIGIPFGQIVSEMALAGYSGTSNGHKYPSCAKDLKKELDLRGMRFSEPWVSTYFTLNDMCEKTLHEADRQLQFIEDMKSGDLVLAELGNSSHVLPDVALVPNAAKFNNDQWQRLGDGLNEIGRRANCRGIKMCYHHHMGTGVMTSEEIDRLAEITDPDLVSICLDTGHLHFAGGDSLNFIKRHGQRIKHVHLKNIRQNIMDEALQKNMSFKEAILAGVFTVPGDPEGSIDFAPILQALADRAYQGWLVVEAEQDPAKATPLKYAKLGRDYLREVTGL